MFRFSEDRSEWNLYICWFSYPLSILAVIFACAKLSWFSCSAQKAAIFLYAISTLSAIYQLADLSISLPLVIHLIGIVPVASFFAIPVLLWSSREKMHGKATGLLYVVSFFSIFDFMAKLASI